MLPWILHYFPNLFPELQHLLDNSYRHVKTPGDVHSLHAECELLVDNALLEVLRIMAMGAFTGMFCHGCANQVSHVSTSDVLTITPLLTPHHKNDCHSLNVTFD